MSAGRFVIAGVVAAVAVLSVAATGCGSTAADTMTTATSAAPAAGSASGPPPGGDMTGGAGGADTSAAKASYLDVAYASKSAAEKLDIHLPSAGSAPYPVIISVHGGAFLMGDKADGQLTPMLAGLDRGYAVVSVNYRLSSEAKFPAAVNDVKAAIRFLRANASKYGLDPQKFAVWGGSAGGNLVSMVGTGAGVGSLSDPSLGNASQSDAVQAVVDWFGPIDFASMDPQFEESGAGSANHGAADSPESQYLGAPLASVPQKVKASDPTTYISADDPPFLIEHGTVDAQVPVQQSQEFAAALTKSLGSGKVTLKLLDGAGHADPAFSTQDNVAYVLDWLDAQLKQ